MTDGEKLDLLLSKFSVVEENMATKAHLEQVEAKMTSNLEQVEAKMVTKDYLEDQLKQVREEMVTKDYLEGRLHELENGVLEEVDRVQEKSNMHYQTLSWQMNQLNNSMNNIEIHNNTINIILKSVANLQEDVKILKRRVDKITQ